MTIEKALTIDCAGDSLIAIAHLADNAIDKGVLVVVGGPQYRVGSHRQFTLLARHLAAHGISVLRFDHRGIGDSCGVARSFLDLDSDIRCAIDTFVRTCPELKHVYIWGLCDAASAALLYAHTDSRVSGLVLLNPWVRTQKGMARTLLKNHYLKRLSSHKFWKTVLTGKHNLWDSLSSLFTNITAAAARRSKEVESSGPECLSRADCVEVERSVNLRFPDRMLSGLNDFDGRVLFVMSGDDLTAAEFRDLTKSDRRWKKSVGRPAISWIELPESNHTFSSREWRDRVSQLTTDWIIDN